MKTANIRTMRHDLASVLKHVRNGETVAITHHKHTVALLTPVPSDRQQRRQPWTGLRARLPRLLAQPTAPQTAAEMLTSERERY